MDYQDQGSMIQTTFSPPQPHLEMDLEMLSSVTLARLVEEVKNEGVSAATKYDRTYNRHNR